MDFFSCCGKRTTLKEALRRRLAWEFFIPFDLALVIILFFHICFCFNGLAVLFRVTYIEIFTMFKKSLFNANCTFYKCIHNLSIPALVASDHLI